MKHKDDIFQALHAFLVGGGLQKFIHDFRDPSLEAMLHQQAHYDKASDSLRTTTFGWDEFPYDFCTIRYFKVELERKLNELKSETISRIEKFKKKHNKSPNKLKGLQNSFSEELKSIGHQLKKEQEFGKYWLQFESFFSELALESSSKINDQMTRTPSKLSFKKHCSNDTLFAIYNLDIKNYSFIDRDKTSYKDFLTIFTSSNIFEIDERIKIYFDCDTRTAAYILEMTGQRFFTNLTRRTIGQSERFYSKWGELVSQNNLEVGIKRGNLPVKNQREIDVFFAKLVLSIEQQ